MRILKNIIVTLLLFAFLVPASLAQNKPNESKKEFQAASPAKCGSIDDTGRTPWNCLFLEEPIGGKVGFDLYIENCVQKDKKDICKVTLWSGGSIPPNTRGPIQAILTAEKDKAYQGPFGLLYSYVNLVYDYMSGLIVGVVIFFIVLGGIQMTTSGGDTSAFDAGKSRITKALVGLVIWFLASLILYTINPTFFTF